MKKTNVLSSPRLDRTPAAENKWAQEQRAFLRLRPALLRSYRNKFVAVHQGKVVDCGEDKVALGLRVYRKFGYVPIYVGQVLAAPQRALRLPSPRLPSTIATK